MKNENYNQQYQRNNSISNNVHPVSDDMESIWVTLVKIIIPAIVCTVVGIGVVFGVCYLIDKLIYNL